MTASNRHDLSPIRAAVPLLALLLLAAPSLTGAAAAQPVALTGATIHPVSGPPIEGGVLVVDGTEIAAVLPAGSAAPAGAEVVDLAGKHIYPGFLHATSRLGIFEVGSIPVTQDHEEGGSWNANIRAESAVNADSFHLPVAVSGGVLTAHVTPEGGLVSGTSAVIRLEGWNWEEMTVAAPVAMHLNLPRLDGSRSATGKEEIEKIDLHFEAARAYHAARSAAEAGTAPAIDIEPRLEGLRPLLAGDIPLFIHAERSEQIEAAIEWVEKQEIGNWVLVAEYDAARYADKLAAAGVPVILRNVLSQPRRDWEPYDATFTAAARLHEAGVKVAITDRGQASSARNLPFHAAMAAAHGLPQDVALRAVTLTPAEILGVADRLGSLEAGKEATFFVATGDPLEIRTTIERAWIAGAEVDMSEDRQRQLYEKYKNRPAPR